MTVASDIAGMPATVAPASSNPSISTVKLMAPKRSSWPWRSVTSATRWLSMKVPLALPWSTTVKPSPRRWIFACRRETDPSGHHDITAGIAPDEGLVLRDLDRSAGSRDEPQIGHVTRDSRGRWGARQTE